MLTGGDAVLIPSDSAEVDYHDGSISAVATAFNAEPHPLPPHEQLPLLQDPHLPLHLICERLRNHLNIEGSVPAVVNESCRQLGLETTGSLLERAELCYSVVFGDSAIVVSPGLEGVVVAGRPLDSGMQVPVAVGIRVGTPAPESDIDPHHHLQPEDEPPRHENAAFAQPTALLAAVQLFEPLIRCEAQGGSYDSFRGDWELSIEMPVYNGRPHYTHTLNGMATVAHLFHCIDHYHGVPRWVIGPAPGEHLTSA